MQPIFQRSINVLPIGTAAVIIAMLLFFGAHIPGRSQKQVEFNPQLFANFSLLNNKTFECGSLENERGEWVNLSAMKGKTMYVDFWFTTCVPCLKEIPHADAVKKFFQSDTNIVFVNICIDNIEKKPLWRKLVDENQIAGINLFYVRNRPQIINVPRLYHINDYPTYLLVNKDLKIIGYNAPRPSERGTVHWAIYQAAKNVNLSESYRASVTHPAAMKAYLSVNKLKIDSLQPR